MRILGLDPGIEKTGFAILEMGKNTFNVLDFGCIETSKKEPFSHRLTDIAGDLKKIIRQWKPSAAGLEQIFFSKNVKSAMRVSHARGVIMEVLEEEGVPVFEFNPGEIKLAVTGDGRADKAQIKKMIHYTLGIAVKNDDTADAIACGICLLTTHKS